MIDRKHILGLLDELSSAVTGGDKAQVEKVLESLKKAEEKVAQVGELNRKRAKFTEAFISVQSTRAMMAKVLSKISSRLFEVEKQLDCLLGPKPVSFKEACILSASISPSVAAPRDFSPQHPRLPWGVVGFKPESGQTLENSSLYFRYKNNPEYDQCPLPEITYAANTQENIIRLTNISARIVGIEVKGRLVLQVRPLQAPGRKEKPVAIYTDDESTPSIFNLKSKPADIINVFSSGVVKIRAYHPGMIESPVVVFVVTVLEPNGSALLHQELIERPRFVDLNSSDESDSERSYLDNINMRTWQEQISGTPRD